MPDTRMDLTIRAKNLASRGLKEVQRDLGALSRSSMSVTRSITSSFGRMARGVGRQLFSLKGAIVALGLGFLAKSFIDVAKTTEGLRIRLVALLGSVREGNMLFQDLTKFAARVPFEYREIMASATQLAGVMKGGREEIMKWLPLIGDLAAATGLGIQETTTQVQKMLSAGAAAAERFRDLGILAMLGFTAGVAYTAEETRKVLWKEWEKQGSRFRGLTQELAKSWTGMMSMLSDAWFLFRSDVMESGLFEYLKAMFQTILNWIDRLKAEGKFEAIAKLIGQTILKALTLVTKALAFIIKGFAELARILGGTSGDALVLANSLYDLSKELSGLDTNLGKATANMDKFQKKGNRTYVDVKHWTEEQRKFAQSLTAELRTPLEELEHWHTKSLKMAKNNATLRILIEEVYTKRRVELIRKTMKEELKADKEREEKHKKMLEDLYKNDLAYWIRVTQNAENGTEKIEDAWYEVRRIVEEQNIGMTKGFKIGWSDAVDHFQTVGHRMAELGRDTAQNLHQTFSDYFFDVMMGEIHTLEDAWKSFTDYLKSAFIRAISDIIASNAIQSLSDMLGIGGTKGGKTSGWDLFDFIGGIGKGIGTIGGWLGGAWDWISGWFHSGGPVGKTGRYQLESGEYVIPKDQVDVFKAAFGSENLDKVFGGKTQPGKRNFQQGGEVRERQQSNWFTEIMAYMRRIQTLEWLWSKLSSILGLSSAGFGTGTAGLFGGFQTAGGTTLTGGGMAAESSLWASLSPYLTAAGLGYIGGGLIGQYTGPKWFGTAGQYGGYGGALGGVAGYAGGAYLGGLAGGISYGAAGGAVGGMAGGAALGSWIPVIGTILGAIIGGVVGSAFGPEAHESTATAIYSITGEQLLKGDFPELWVNVESTHGRGFAKNASQLLVDQISAEFWLSLSQMKDILTNLPNANEVAKMLGTFDLKISPGGGRSADLVAWGSFASGESSRQLAEWFSVGMNRMGYRINPEELLAGASFGRLGYMPGSWEEVYGHMHRGGMVPKTGPYILEKGERVVPKEKVNEKPMVQNIFNINVSPIDAADFKRKIRKEIIPEIENKIRKYGYIRSVIKEI